MPFLDGVADHIAFVCTGATQRVVPAARVGHDGQQHRAPFDIRRVPVVR